MTTLIFANRIPRRFVMLRYGLEQKLNRFARGVRYALEKSTLDDGYRIHNEMASLIGCYSLSEISSEDVLECARDEYEDGPVLTEVCEHAASRVAQKWSSTGDETGAAVDWAMDLVREWMTERGIAAKPD